MEMESTWIRKYAYRTAFVSVNATAGEIRKNVRTPESAYIV